MESTIAYHPSRAQDFGDTSRVDAAPEKPARTSAVFRSSVATEQKRQVADFLRGNGFKVVSTPQELGRFHWAVFVQSIVDESVLMVRVKWDFAWGCWKIEG